MAALGIQYYPVFFVTAMMLSLFPGPSTMYVVGRSVAQGRRAGLVSMFGVCGGTLCHVVAVAFGVSAIFAASQMAFMIVKTVGAIYLAYLGIVLLVNRKSAADHIDAVEPIPTSDWKTFAQGSLTQILNPKVTLFFLAILPQFVVPTSAHAPLPFLVLGATFVTTDLLWFSILICLTSLALSTFRRSERAVDFMRRATGVLYISLGLALLRERARATH